MLAFLTVLRHALSAMVGVAPYDSGVDAANRNAVFEVRHPCGLLIQRALLEADAKAVPAVRTRDLANGYRWYQLPRAEIAGQMVSISLCFFKNALDLVTVEVVDRDQSADPWKDWSPEKQQVWVDAARRWLADVGCPVGEYPWGTVFAEADVRSGGGGGGVRFR